MPGIVYCSRGTVCVLCELFPRVTSAGPSHNLKPEMGNDMVRGAVKSGRKLSKAARKSGEQVPTVSYSSSEEEEDEFFEASETVRYV